MTKGLMLCSQHIILAIQMEFPPKEHQFSLLLTRKEKLQKCQKIPIISAGGKNTSVLTLGGNQTRLAAVDYLDRKWCYGSFFHSKMANFALPVTLSSATFTVMFKSNYSNYNPRELIFGGAYTWKEFSVSKLGS